MPTEPTVRLDDKTMLNRLQLASELQVIQAQTHESLKSELGDARRELERLRDQLTTITKERNELASAIEEYEDCRAIEESEYASLKAAEHHLSRLLHQVDRSPVGLLARRRPGFRSMIDRWPAP